MQVNAADVGAFPAVLPSQPRVAARPRERDQEVYEEQEERLLAFAEDHTAVAWNEAKEIHRQPTLETRAPGGKVGVSKLRPGVSDELDSGATGLPPSERSAF